MSKGSNGKERGGAPPITSFYSSFYHSITSSYLVSLPHSLFPSLLVPSFFHFLPPFSIPLFVLTSLPPCVVMCNVLKLARSTADCCRYRLISHKSGCSDQLPHRGPTDRETDTGGRLSERVVFCVRQLCGIHALSDLPGLINRAMTDNTHFQSISLPV